MHDSAKQSSWVVYSNLLLRDVLSDCITGKGLFSSADCYVMALHLQQGHHTRPSVKCKWLTLPEGYATLRDRSCQGSVCSIPRCSMTVAVAAVNSVVLRRLKTSPTVAAVHMPGQMSPFNIYMWILCRSGPKASNGRGGSCVPSSWFQTHFQLCCSCLHSNLEQRWQR